MIALEIDNSYSKIAGLTPSQFKALNLLLSYTVGDHFSAFGPTKRTLLSKKGDFPSGLAAKVVAWLIAERFDFDVTDKRIRPPISKESTTNYPVIPYPAQLQAVDTALKLERGTITMPTGTGKSLVIAMLAARLDLKTLVIVPSLEIKKQLQEVLKKQTNITVQNIDSRELQTTKAAYDCLIIDEAHHVAAKTYQKLNKTVWKGIYYRFFLTATPFRNNEEETLLFEALAGPEIFRLTYEEAVSNKYIVPVDAYYYQLPKQATEAYTWAQVYNELVVNNDLRNEIIVKTLDKLRSINVSVLCLVKEVKHGQLLAAMSGVPFVSGQDEDSRVYIKEFNSGRLKTLIATTGIMGEGVDTKPCEYVIIAGLGKAKSAFMQQVGRGVRRYAEKESCKIILFKDDSHKFTSRHYKAQRAILKTEYNVIPTKLEV